MARVKLRKTHSTKTTKGFQDFRKSYDDYSNREIGWLIFNQRVLKESEETKHPLLERLKFLVISISNLDEFFMKRVGGLKQQVEFNVSAKSNDGKSPSEQLIEIRKFAIEMYKEQDRIYSKVIKPLLKVNNIYFKKWKDLNQNQRVDARNFYLKNIFPVLTPLSVDPGHPFPFISNLSMSLGVTLRHPGKKEKLFARIKIPKVLPQWIKVQSDNKNELVFISTLEVVKANLSDLFPEMELIDVMPFRLTRNANMDLDHEDSEDLLESVEEELKQRKFAEVVRLECGPKPDIWMLKFLIEELEISKEDVYVCSEEIIFSDLQFISDLKINYLRNPAIVQSIPIELIEDEASTFFHQIKLKDFLIHNPYENFSQTVEKFVLLAASDPKVLAIKMTLYRTGDKSAFIKAMIRAAESGKQVVCLVELKARFDEERNIYWAQELENAGVHVVYGLLGYKTHAKTCLVVRQETEGLRTYAHIGTGNYNSGTARFYTDLGLLTADERITNELVDFFHFLTGRSLKSQYEYLLIAPINMHAKFLKLIEREEQHKINKKPAEIIAKFNNMEETSLTQSLYRASQRGVEINLIVRGFCCLKPGLKGKSENIKVTSIIGRFLEHSRIFYFRNGSEDPIDGDFFIGSADWMYRNLHSRVECIVPILDRKAKEKCYEILKMNLNDTEQAWAMSQDGTYKKKSGNGISSQIEFTKLYQNASIKELVSKSESEN